MPAFVLMEHLWQVIHNLYPSWAGVKTKWDLQEEKNRVVSAWENRYIGTHKPFLRPEQRFLFTFDKKSTYPLNLSGFHAFQCLPLLSGCGMATVRNSWEMVRDPTPPRMPACCTPSFSDMMLTPAASRSLQELLWCPVWNQGCLEQLFSGKCAFMLFNMFHRDVAGTSMAFSRLLGPWFPSHAWAYALMLPSFPGWKWSRGIGRLQGLSQSW